MKKELPRLYRGSINNGTGNNLRVAHGFTEEEKSPRQTINELFKENQIYRQDVEIETDKEKLTTKIIGRTQEHIITINNTVIRIDDIKHLKLIK